MTTTPAPSVPDPGIGPRAPSVQDPGRRWPAVTALRTAAHSERADAPAVVGVDGVRTFRWLAATSEQVAAHVRHAYPTPEAHLGVVRRSTTHFVATVLGCMQAGVTFSVIAPGSQINPRFLGVAATIDIDEDSGHIGATRSDDVVGLEPSSASESEDWASRRLGLGPDDRIALWSGIAGQVVSTISTAVCSGATLVITPPPITDAAALAELLHVEGITVLVTTAPILRSSVARSREAAWPGLRLVVVDHGGELLPADVTGLHRVSPTAVFASTYRTDRLGVPLAFHLHEGALHTSGSALLLAGTPPEGSALAVRNTAGRPVGLGEIGEVCAGSAHTGDLARRWPDGTLELVGTVDVERDMDRAAALAALRELPGVYDAVIIGYPTDDRATIWTGYLAGPVATLEPAEARRSLALRLPDRLIPRYLVVLDALPLTSAGLHDLDALPEVDHDGAVADRYVSPRTPLEHVLCAMLQDLLGVERVGIDDSFFQLGGFSLLATQLTTPSSAG